MDRTAIDALFASPIDQAIPVVAITADEFQSDVYDGDGRTRNWASLNGFKAGAGEVLTIPSADGTAIDAVLLGLGDGLDPLVTGALAKALPEGLYRLADNSALGRELALIGFGLGAYSFSAYKHAKPCAAQLIVDETDPLEAVIRQLEACWLARDLVNTPANDMGPDALETQARQLAERHGADIQVVQGDDLLVRNLPMIHAVGRASATAPRLIDLVWGNDDAPKLTLVGKGVAYDTGGLNIKPGSSMRNMKKDMGGAAHVLALAHMIMASAMKVRLRVLIPAVENAISGSAFRPGDILQTRKGLTVEIGNTDAEGRLVLGDALTLASEESPERIIDMATLTGAARVALGPDIPPFFTSDEAFAADLAQASQRTHDPIWRMPLWKPYAKGLSSKVADCCNITNDGFAGSVTAALFLQKFVDEHIAWTHIDIFAWSQTAKPHAGIGGEAQAIRALFAALSKHY